MPEPWNNYKGDIWDLAVDHTIVIPTNLHGVMGRGLALQAKQKVPDIQIWYQEALKYWQGKPMLVYNPLLPGSESGSIKLAMFPVKYHWAQKADRDLIYRSALSLRHYIVDKDVFQIALPQVGCGFGELDWEDIKDKVLSILRPVKDYITLVAPSPNLLRKYPQAFVKGARRDKLWNQK